MELFEALTLVKKEVETAENTFSRFNSFHEGYAVLLEEIDELWQEIKTHDPKNIEKIRSEAIQVSAMGLRIIIDLT